MPIVIEGTNEALATQAGKCAVEISHAAAFGKKDPGRILQKSGAKRLEGHMLFLFPDESVAHWDGYVSTWTIFTSLEAGLEAAQLDHRPPPENLDA